jgi:hypothetical protein
MSVNDTTLCKVAKKLHNISPATVIDDPSAIERLLVTWFDKFMADEMELPDMDSDEDTAISKWIGARYEEEKKMEDEKKVG